MEIIDRVCVLIKYSGFGGLQLEEGGSDRKSRGGRKGVTAESVAEEMAWEGVTGGEVVKEEMIRESLVEERLEKRVAGETQEKAWYGKV